MRIIHLFKRTLGFQQKPKPSFNQQILAKLDQRLEELEKGQAELRRILTEGSWAIEKVVIENMHADKFEFNLDSIDVRELSGMLSIGLNYGGKLVKVSPPGSEQKPGEQEEKQKVRQDKPHVSPIKLNFNGQQEQ